MNRVLARLSPLSFFSFQAQRGIGISLALTLLLSTAAMAGDKPTKKPASDRTQSAIALPDLPSKSNVKVELDASAAGPRQIEDTTEKAIVRDYGNAWSVMASALENNRSDILGSAFVGTAQDALAQKIKQQRTSGLRTRYIDHGHKLRATFYSPEGSAMQLRDIANVELQLLDGDKIVSRQQLTLNYVSVMTVGEERWKVRLLEAVPAQ